MSRRLIKSIRGKGLQEQYPIITHEKRLKMKIRDIRRTILHEKDREKRCFLNNQIINLEIELRSLTNES